MWLIKSMILMFLFGQYGGQAFTISELTPILEALKIEIRAEFKTQLGEIVTVVQDQGTQIDEINTSQKWTRLVLAQETCAQLLSLFGEGFDGRKEIINPDGRKPIEVECRNGDTTAGKVFQVDVPQCSGQYCFKFVAPLPENDLAQMKNLVDRSLECVQQIEIKCLGAPLQFNGENLFQLIDYSGRNQTINTEHACDAKSPIVVEASMNITDEAILPLRGFFYGPLDVAGQKFSVKVGKLICKANFTYEESLSVQNLEAKLTSHGSRITINEEYIEKRRLGTFAKCNQKWCLQSGLTKEQYTKCGSVTNEGRTCNNPEIRYGSTTGGLPSYESHHQYPFNKWCKQLGGTYSTHTLGTRTGYCVYWYTGSDEPGAKWRDCGDGNWYNSSLDSQQTGSDFITSITCN